MFTQNTDLCTYMKTIYMHCYKRKGNIWLNTVMFVPLCFTTQKAVYRYLSSSFVLQLFPLMTECGKLPTFPFYMSNISELLAREIQPLVTLQHTRNPYKGKRSTAILKPISVLSGAVEISVYSHRQIPACTAALQDQLRQQFGNRSVATNMKDNHLQRFQRKHHTTHKEKRNVCRLICISKISSQRLLI